MLFKQINQFFRSITSAQKRAFLTGLREAVTPLIAVGTWGFVTGIAMVKSGLTEGMAVLMTLLVYAGSAQLTALPLIESGAPLWLIFAAGMVVNVRFIIFGAALYPYFRYLSKPKMGFLSFLISDIGFVIFMSRYGGSKRVGTNQQLWYFLGILVPGWVVWNSSSILGIYMGGFVPQSWSLEFAATLALLAIVVPLVKTQPMVLCLIVAGTMAWITQSFPLRLGLAAAVIAGVAAGVIGEKYANREKRRMHG